MRASFATTSELSAAASTRGAKLLGNAAHIAEANAEGVGGGAPPAAVDEEYDTEKGTLPAYSGGEIISALLLLVRFPGVRDSSGTTASPRPV